jgi:hypothetical protein
MLLPFWAYGFVLRSRRWSEQLRSERAEVSRLTWTQSHLESVNYPRWSMKVLSMTSSCKFVEQWEEGMLLADWRRDHSGTRTLSKRWCKITQNLQLRIPLPLRRLAQPWIWSEAKVRQLSWNNSKIWHIFREGSDHTSSWWTRYDRAPKYLLSGVTYFSLRRRKNLNSRMCCRPHRATSLPCDMWRHRRNRVGGPK